MIAMRPTGAEESRDVDAGRTSVLGLRIPAEAGRPVTVAVAVSRLTAPVLSEAIGGRLLEDALTAKSGGSSYTFYVDEHRVAKRLPWNERAAVLSARLGHVTRACLADLRGDVLVLGCDNHLDDVSAPWFVVDAAIRSGLFVEGAGAGR